MQTKVSVDHFTSLLLSEKFKININVLQTLRLKARFSWVVQVEAHKAGDLSSNPGPAKNFFLNQHLDLRVWEKDLFIEYGTLKL